MKEEPLVLCLTNTVAANFTANAVLAVGAKPAMIEEPSEAAELAAIADALLVNVGTLTPAQADVMRAAIRVARQRNLPWVLDPVAVHCLSFRAARVAEFLASRPALIRGNRQEIDFLLSAHPALSDWATLLATGLVDRVSSPQRAPCEISGGVSLLQKVTATGCAQGALCAVLLARGLAPFEAACTASRLMKTAGERAFATARLPGSFQPALLDALAEVSHD